MRTLLAIIISLVWLLSVNAQDTGDRKEVKEVLKSFAFKFDKVPGIGHEQGCTRRDPSDVIRVGDTWYVWYTKVYGRSPGYWGTIWYATSKDQGFNWEEKGEALGIGPGGAFDAQAVFTPNILYSNGKYYLYYTGVKPTPGRTDGVFENNSTNDITAIGVAVAGSPGGPYKRIGNEPIISVSKVADDFDSYRVDDAVLNVRDGKYWLYFKGRSMAHGQGGPGHTMMGVAFSDKPTGPFVKHRGNPILNKSHEVFAWRQGKGIACLASLSSTLEYAPDGIDFERAPLGIPVPVRQRPLAAGAFRTDLTNPDTEQDGLTWGISMVHNGDEAYLIRWSVK